MSRKCRMLVAKIALIHTAAISIVLRIAGKLCVNATGGASTTRANTRATAAIVPKRATSTDVGRAIKRFRRC